MDGWAINQHDPPCPQLAAKYQLTEDWLSKYSEDNMFSGTTTEGKNEGYMSFLVRWEKGLVLEKVAGGTEQAVPEDVSDSIQAGARVLEEAEQGRPKCRREAQITTTF